MNEINANRDKELELKQIKNELLDVKDENLPNDLSLDEVKESKNVDLIKADADNNGSKLVLNDVSNNILNDAEKESLNSVNISNSLSCRDSNDLGNESEKENLNISGWS